MAIDINDLRNTLGQQLIEALQLKNALTLAQRAVAEKDAALEELRARLAEPPDPGAVVPLSGAAAAEYVEGFEARHRQERAATQERMRTEFAAAESNAA